MRLDTAKKVSGDASVENKLTKRSYWTDFWFETHDGREFDATQSNAELRFFMAVEAMGFDNRGYIRLYDKAGLIASQVFHPPVDSNFHEYAFTLGSTAPGWTAQQNFDWRFIKRVKFQIAVSQSPWAILGSIWVDRPHFNYYKLVRPKLTIDSAPRGKNYAINGNIGKTPFSCELDPDTDYSVYMDPAGFDHWQDGETANPKTVRMGDGEVKTIMAIYKGAVGRVNVVAFLDSQEVNAQITITETGDVKTTPFEAELASGVYTLNAVYSTYKETKHAVVEDGETTYVKFVFVTEPPPGKGKLYCTALLNSTEVTASVQVGDVGTYDTPFSIELSPGTYGLKATYGYLTVEKAVVIVEGKINKVTVMFKAPSEKPPVSWIAALAIMASLAGIAIVLSRVRVK